MPSKPIVARALYRARAIKAEAIRRSREGDSVTSRDACTAVFVHDTTSRHPLVQRLNQRGGAAVLLSLLRVEAATLSEIGHTPEAAERRLEAYQLAREGVLVLELYPQPWHAREAVRRGNPFACLHAVLECPHCGGAFTPEPSRTEWLQRLPPSTGTT